MAYKSRFYQQKYQGQEQNNVESNDNSRYKSQFYRSGAYKNAEGASGLKPTETKERLNTELWQRVDNNSVTNTPRKQTANITHMGSVSENSYGSNQQSEYERLLNLNPQKAKASIQSLRTQIEKIPNYSSEELREKYPNHQAAVKHMSDLEDQIKKIEEDIQKSEKIKKYASYQNAEDFLQFSSKGAAIKNPTYKEAEGNAYIFGWRPGADPVGNIVTYSRDNYEHIRDEENGESRGVGAVGKSLYHYMSDDEVGLYNYILAKHGDKEAKEYLDSIEETLNYRSGTEQAKLIRDNENGFLRTLGTVNYGVGAGLDQSISGAKQFFSDEKLPTSATQYGSAYIREDLEDAGPKILGSSLGQIGYDTLTTTANMAPSILLSSITAGLGAPAAVASGLGAASMGLSASGNAYGQALSEGYGKEEARSYSLLVGASEAALQYLLGGISKLGGKLTGNVAKKTVQNIDNALLRIAVDTGIHMASEGSEEYLQEILEPAFRNLCFDENNEIKLVSEDAAYSFLLGALTSGFMEGGNIAKSGISLNKTGEAIQRQGKYEELLENALTMDPSSEAGRIASQLKNGTLHVNSSNIGELYLNYAAEGGNLDFVSAPVENTETVQKAAQQSPEAALYQAAMEKVTEENVSASIPVSDTVQENTSVQKRPQDLSISEPVKSSNSISATSNSLDLISRAASVLGNEGKQAIVKSYDGKTDPAEYYASFARYYNVGLNGQKASEIQANGLTLEQQIAAYESGAKDRYTSLQKERGNVKYATAYGKESGFVWDQNKDNISKESAQAMNAVGKALGVKIMMADQVKDGTANASYENGVVTIARDAQNPVMTVLSHELTHRMQELAPDEYRVYRDYVASSVLETGNNNAYIADIQQRYQKSGEFLTQEGAMDELAAEYAEVMMGQTDLFADFVKQNRTTAQKIVDCFKNILEKLKSVIHSLTGEERQQAQQMKAEMEEAVKRWESAFKASEKQVSQIQEQKNTASESGKGRYSIKYDENNQPFVVVDEDILDGVPKNQWVKAVKNNLREKFPEGVTVGNNIIHINQQSRREMTFSKYMQQLLRQNPQIYADKFRATNNADEILKASRNYVNEALLHPRKDAIIDFARGEVMLRIGNNEYSAQVIIGNRENGSLMLYDIINLSPINIQQSTKKVDADYTTKPQKETGSRQSVSTTTSISNSSENVNGKFSLKGSSDALQAQLDEAVKKYGAIPTGENPSRDIQVPKKATDNKNERISQTVRTVLEAKATPDIALPTIEEMALEGKFSYQALSDKKAISDAEATIKNKGWTSSLSEWLQKTNNGSVNKNNTAMGWALYNNAVNSGDIETSINILENMVLHQRNAAQAVQASRILKKLSPEGQLYGVMRSAENLTQEIKERYGRDTDITVDKELAEKFLKAPNETAREEALEKLYMDIGRQLPSRFMDKWNAWRYLAMLGNPRTHVRNIAGNALFMPVVAIKDLTGTAIESVAYKLSGGKLGRTKGTLTHRDMELVKAAWNDYPYIKDEALGEGKYSDLKTVNQSIEKGRKIFHFKPLEAARKANSKALDVEDTWFSQPHYSYALAQYAKANHISAESIKSGLGIDAARAYAIKEAQKATYRDSNAFSNFVSSLGRRGQNINWASKAASTLVEGVLPFRKTPANILARGVEYSPIGLLKGLSVDLYQMSQGKKTGAEVIDNVSAGLTGTGILTLGAFLAAQGILRGRGGDDDDKRNFYDLMGYQDYALCLPDGTSVTLDWMAPEALPLFVGANLYEQMSSKQRGLTFADILDSISNISEPMLEMSMLQSLNDLFDSVGYASSQGLSGLAGSLVSAATSYLTQGIPTLAGQLERTAQQERMTTYTDNNGFLTGDAQYFLGSASAKIPGWDYHQIPYIDAWGRKESTGKSMSYRAFSNMLNPAYVDKTEESAMEKELLRLYDATDEASVFPERAKRYFNVGNERIDLTADQYVTYATKKGQKSYQLLSALVQSDAYKNSSDEEKCDLISECYAYANARAKQSVSSYDGGSYNKMIATVKKTNVDELSYLILKEQCSGLESLKDADGETIDNSLSLLKMQTIYNVKGLTDEQRKAMFEDFGVGKKVRHYNKALVNSKLAQMEKR